MKIKLPIIILSIIILLIGGIAYFNMNQSTVSHNFILNAREFGYNSTEGGPTIKVKVGDTVTITFINVGEEEHEFMIVSKDTLATSLNPETAKMGETGFEKVIGGHPEPVFEGATIHDTESGDTKTISFVANIQGTYAYACFLDVPDGILHTYLGMWGEFIVEL